MRISDWSSDVCSSDLNEDFSGRLSNRPPIPDLEIVYQDPRALTPDPRNPRRHSKKQIAQLKASLVEFDFVTPILIDAEHRVVRSAESRVGKECVSTCRSRGSTYH